MTRLNLDKLKTKFANWRFRHDQAQGAKLWSDASWPTVSEVHQRISEAILGRVPFAAGKLGPVEATCLLWSRRIPQQYPWMLRWTTQYWETTPCTTNAGIRPRSPESYRRFADCLVEALEVTDLLGVFKLQAEHSITRRFCRRTRYYNPEYISLTMAEGTPWPAALTGLRVFVVSPFLDTFQRQMDRLNEIWPEPGFMPEFDLTGYRFPYLIDDDCGTAWWRVMDDVKESLSRSSYDVALFGCGGVGLPLAAFARDSGKVGLHLGGFLQLLFGVYGNRHLTQEWHKRHINDFWVRPAPAEVARTAARVEGSCYW